MAGIEAGLFGAEFNRGEKSCGATRWIMNVPLERSLRMDAHNLQ